MSKKELTQEERALVEKVARWIGTNEYYLGVDHESDSWFDNGNLVANTTHDLINKFLAEQ